MSRPWQYTRSRRTLMQGVMWLILGGTVGLAALVDNRRTSPRNVPLDPPVRYGFLGIRPPKGWVARQEQGQLVFHEEGSDADAEDDETGRVLIVQQEPGVFKKPDAYLLQKAGALRGLVREAGVSAVTMAGQKGYLVALPERTIVVNGQSAALGWTILACTVVPDNIGVALQLRMPRRPAASDYALVKAVAANLEPLTAPARPDEGPRRPGPGDED